MTIQLSDGRERQVRSLLREGRYGSVEEVIEDALRLLDRQRPVEEPLTEAEFDQYLLDAGLMSRLPTGEADPDDPLIEIVGEPLSETVLRDRR
jgi:Arc/MetJ-type ribon-helix-helix transcriptional regulator